MTDTGNQRYPQLSSSLSLLYSVLPYDVQCIGDPVRPPLNMLVSDLRLAYTDTPYTDSLRLKERRGTVA